MLDSIRNAAQTKLAKIILALITVPFALWGIESYIRDVPGQDVIAKVGNQKITSMEFDQAIRNQLERFRAQFGGNISPSMMDNPEMRKSILDQLIDQKLLTDTVKSSGIAVSDAILREKISTEPSFQDGGKFAASRYENFLKSQGYTAIGFENMLREDMQRAQFQESVTNTSFTSSVSQQQFLRASEQSREVAVINITPEPYLPRVQVSSQQAKAFYEQRKTEYTIPDQVRVEFIELSVDALAAQSTLTEEEIKAYYEGNLARYVQKEERKASHILINAAANASDADKKAAKAKAEALYAEVKKNPKNFAELAKKNSQDVGSAPAGGDLGFFGRGAMVKPFEEAAFSAKPNDIIGPIQSDFGFHVIMVTDIHPEKVKTLAEAKPEIEGELKKQKAQRKFAEAAEQFSNLVYEQPSSLKAASEAVKLPVRQSGWISKGMGIPPFDNPKLMEALFSDDVLKNKRNTEAVEIAPNTLIAARILESKPATLRPFPEVEKEIIARLTREEAGKLARQEGEATLKRLKSGQPIERQWPALLAVGRNNPGGLPANVVDVALKADTKALPAYAGVENPGGGYTLIQIAKVLEPNLADESKAKASRQRVAQSLAQQEFQAMLASLREKANVKVSKNALDKKIDR